MYKRQGGIDSAIIARLASARGPISSFTLDVGDDPAEAQNAAETARWLKVPNLQQSFQVDDVIELHKSLVSHLEVPKVNALQSAMLAGFAAEHVKVALSGLGGDELFYGYNAHGIMRLAQQANRLTPGRANSMLAAALKRALFSSPAWSEPQRAVEMYGAMPDWSRVYGILRNVWDSPQLRVLVYGQRMLDAAPTDSFGWLAREFPSDANPLEAMQRFEFRNKMVNDLLWHEDRVSMRVGLEVRVPFLDWDLVGFANAKSSEQLMPRGSKKAVLKEYARTILPSAVLARRKSGFQLNIAEAVSGVLKPVIDEYLTPERMDRHRLFNPQFVRQVLRQPYRQSRRWHYFMLYLMAQTHMLVEAFDVE